MDWTGWLAALHTESLGCRLLNETNCVRLKVGFWRGNFPSLPSELLSVKAAIAPTYYVIRTWIARHPALRTADLR